MSRATTKSGLLLRDSLTFLTLCGVSVVLFVLTLLLFRSFESHREELGQRWAERGRVALQQGHPAEAVVALRTALTYRNDLPAQLLLAQALAHAGRTEEATNYFLTLRETRPGDGLINLQLARLMRKQGDAQEAVNDYRAAIFGNWEGDGTLRRRETRLELASYLASRGETNPARDEILIAAGNMPESAASDVMIGDRLMAIGANQDAIGFYEKALALNPRDKAALSKAGRLAYSLGHYGQAEKLLSAALAEHSHGAAAAGDKDLAALAANARRVPELTLSRDLPASVRAEHLLLASGIAQRRLQGCMASPNPGSGAAVTNPAAQDPRLAGLRTRWTGAAGQLKKRTLERDAALEDNVAQLVEDTERQTTTLCGVPEGDDALLLMLANAPQAAR